MRVLHWCMLGATTLLLVCEVTISQLCHSLITLVVGFHTLFVFMCMAFLSPQTANVGQPQPSSLDPPASPPHVSSSSSPCPSVPAAEPPIEPSPGLHAATEESNIPVNAPTPHPNPEAASVDHSHEITAPSISPPALSCGLSYADSRSETFKVFFSVLILASMCMSYLLEIITFFMDPQPVQHPLLLVVVGAVSLLHKMLALRLSWDQLKGERGWVARGREAECHLEVNHGALAVEEDQPEPGRVLDDVSHVRAAVDHSLHNGVLILCNPGASSIPEADSQAQEQQQEVRLHSAAPQDCEVARGVVDLKTQRCESRSEDVAKDSTCVEHLDSQKSVCNSTHHTESPVLSSRWPVCLLSFTFIIQDLLTSALGLINGLVMLLVSHCLHDSGPCSRLVYLDPCLSLLGVTLLMSIAMPQVCRYGLLVLQGTPPHICVSDLGRRLAKVPGVQAVHDLHIWQLTESLMVASVHVHCYAEFPVHRCADLMSGVTKVLQSVGVSCCTVQPEFVVCAASSAGIQGDGALVNLGEDSSLPPDPACSLSCGKACAGSMCCTPIRETETKEKPEILIIAPTTPTNQTRKIN